MGAGVVRSAPLVLVVDDDERCARVYARVLRAHGLDVRVAVSGADAARVVANDEWETLDGALLDVTLPDASGTEIAARIRARNGRAAIALVSGVVDERAVRAKIIGLNVPLIPKPISEQELSSWATTVNACSPASRFERALAQLKTKHRLTEREVEVVRAARVGSEHYKAIAMRMQISVATVHSHVANIRRKTNAASLGELLERLDRDSGF